MPRIYGLALIPLLGAASCSAPAPDGAAPIVKLEKAGAGDGELITIESDAVVDGQRPKLILVCRPGEAATFRLDLVRPPKSPPPLRVFAQFQVKGGPKVTIELGSRDRCGRRRFLTRGSRSSKRLTATTRSARCRCCTPSAGNAR